MIRLYTNLSDVNLFSLYNYTLVDKDAKCDIAVIEDDFSIVENIHEISPESLIIFITSEYNYVNEALSKHVFAYHIKPIDSNKLEEDMHKIILAYAKRNKKCIIHANNQHIIISNDELIYFTSSYKEIKLVTKTKTYYTHVNHKK